MTVETFQSRGDRLFAAYVEAQTKAKETLHIADGVAAGRAWREFLEEFLPPADMAATIRERDTRRAVQK